MDETRYRFRNKSLRVTPIPSEQHPYYVVEDTVSSKRHRLYEKEYQVASLFDGKLTVAQVADVARERTGMDTQPVDVDRFAQQLLALGFVEIVAEG